MFMISRVFSRYGDSRLLGSETPSRLRIDYRFTDSSAIRSLILSSSYEQFMFFSRSRLYSLIALLFTYQLGPRVHRHVVVEAEWVAAIVYRRTIRLFLFLLPVLV